MPVGYYPGTTQTATDIWAAATRRLTGFTNCYQGIHVQTTIPNGSTYTTGQTGMANVAPEGGVTISEIQINSTGGWRRLAAGVGNPGMVLAFENGYVRFSNTEGASVTIAIVGWGFL